MNYYQFEQFMARLREESKQHSLDGEVSYAYVAGTLESCLRNAVSDNEYVRDAAISFMKESL